MPFDKRPSAPPMGMQPKRPATGMERLGGGTKPPPIDRAPDPFRKGEMDPDVNKGTKMKMARSLENAIDQALAGTVTVDNMARDKLQQLKGEVDSYTIDTGQDNPRAIDEGRMETLSPGPGMRGSNTPLLDKVTKFYEKNYNIATDAGAVSFQEYTEDTEAFISDISTILSFGPNAEMQGLENKLHASTMLQKKDMMDEKHPMTEKDPNFMDRVDRKVEDSMRSPMDRLGDKSVPPPDRGMVRPPMPRPQREPMPMSVTNGDGWDAMRKMRKRDRPPMVR